MKKGKLTIRVGNEEVHFNLNQSLKLSDFEKAFYKNGENVVPISSKLIDDCKNQDSMNENMMNFKSIEDLDIEHLIASFEFKETVLSLNEDNAEKSSIIEEKAQEIEKIYEELIMKELPKHLKYAFLGVEISKPIIIATDLTGDRELKLIRILIKYKEAIAWSMEDFKGISPSICMHKILLKEYAKTSTEHQRRLNPIMKEVVIKEVIKWLNVGFIYAISDSPWVSPVHVVPKNDGFVVIRNYKNELIPTRTMT